MVQTGMRISEVTNFKINWINERDLHIYIQENEKPIKWSPKRESIREVPISEELLKQLKRFIGNKEKGYVFKSQKQKSTKSEITRRTFGRYEYRSLIKKINKISNQTFGKNTGSHIFRHTFASHLLKEKLDIESIRKLLGHNNVRTTYIYIQSLPDYSSWDQVRKIDLMSLNVNLK